MTVKRRSHDPFEEFMEESKRFLRAVKGFEDEMEQLAKERADGHSHDYEALRTMYEGRTCVELATHWVEKTRKALKGVRNGD